MLGHRVEAGGVSWTVIGFLRNLARRRRRPGSTQPDRPLFWERWTARVMARPWPSVAAVSAIMLALAMPVLSMKAGTGALDQFPADHDVRVGSDLAAAPWAAAPTRCRSWPRSSGAGRGPPRTGVPWASSWRTCGRTQTFGRWRRRPPVPKAS
jgi:hypothetical protein